MCNLRQESPIFPMHNYGNPTPYTPTKWAGKAVTTSILPPKQETFSPKEVAAVMALTDRTVCNALAEPRPDARLLGFSFDIKGDHGHIAKRVPRGLLLAWVIGNANYDSQTLRSFVRDLASNLATLAVDRLFHHSRGERHRRAREPKFNVRNAAPPTTQNPIYT